MPCCTINCKGTPLYADKPHNGEAMHPPPLAGERGSTENSVCVNTASPIMGERNASTRSMLGQAQPCAGNTEIHNDSHQEGAMLLATVHDIPTSVSTKKIHPQNQTVGPHSSLS